MRVRTGLVGGVLLVCVGCGPQAIYDKEISVPVNEIQPIVFGPFEKEQTITVAAESPGAPISVYVHEEEQTEFVDYAISYGKTPENVLAGEPSTESTTLTTTVPAGKEIVVRLQATGKEAANVKLKITN